MSDHWVCLDVGETLVDETRVWSAWADELGVPRLTMMAVLGAAIAGGGDHRAAFARLGADDWQLRTAAVEASLGGLVMADLYPDALRAIAGLRQRGYRVAVVANQPAERTEQLRALGIVADVMAMSDELGVAKPDPAFFARALELMGGPEPASVVYVGDRVDNDVAPAIAAGLRVAWLRRGPWGIIGRLPDGVRPALTVGSLDELVDRLDEAWAE